MDNFSLYNLVGTVVYTQPADLKSINNRYSEQYWRRDQITIGWHIFKKVRVLYGGEESSALDSFNSEDLADF